MILYPVFARLAKPAEAISVGTGGCHASLAMTRRERLAMASCRGGVYLLLALESNRAEEVSPRPYLFALLIAALPTRIKTVFHYP